MTPTAATNSDLSQSPAVSETVPEQKVTFRKSLTKQIKLIIVSYGLLAL
jgi:hypothetical protein